MQQSQTIKVHHLSRLPFPGQFSIESVFEQVRQAWNDQRFGISNLVAPCHSKGLLPRLKICRWAHKHQGMISHITGDIQFAALATNPATTILTIHDCYQFKSLKGIKRRLLKSLWFDLPCNRVRYITVVSRQTKEELEKHVLTSRDKIVVIPNAVNPIFKPSPRPFNASCPRILQLGITPNKNLSRVFSALEGLDIHLDIVGNPSGTDMAELTRRGVPHRLHVNLSDTEVFGLYRNCDIVSFPSLYEGFGLPIIEGQFVERPVLTSNCSSMPEVAGPGACLVDPFSVSSIRAGFLRLINDGAYREDLIRQGRLNRTRFSYHAVAQQYAALYAKLGSELGFQLVV